MAHNIAECGHHLKGPVIVHYNSGVTLTIKLLIITT